MVRFEYNGITSDELTLNRGKYLNCDELLGYWG